MIALDTETTGLDLYHGARPYLVTTCSEDGEQRFWEWDVDPETRVPSIHQEDLEEIEHLILTADRLVLQNSKFDVAVIATVLPELEWPWDKTEDTLMAGHLLASSQPHDLTSLVLQYLGEDVKPFEDRMQEAVTECRRLARSRFPSWRIAREGLPDMPSVKGGSSKEGRGSESEKPWKADAWLPRAAARRLKHPEDHPWWTVTQDYANSDSAGTLGVWRQMEADLEKRHLTAIYRERMRVLRPVHLMERRGVTVSVPRIEELRTEFSRDSERHGAECSRIAADMGHELSLPKSGRNKNLDVFVFEVMGLEKLYDPQGKVAAPMLDSKVAIPHYLATLEKGSPQHEFILNLAARRKRDTSLTYLAGYERFCVAASNGWSRIHPLLNPCGTGTLRFSSANPNSQSVGKQHLKDDEGREERSLRYCYGPAPGRVWYSLDYENIELRIPGYESGERELIDLFERSDEPPYYGSEHILNFSTVYPDIWEEAIKKVGLDRAGPYVKEEYKDTWYRWVKFGGFAVGYGAIEKADMTGTADRAFRRPGSHARLKARFARKEELNRRYIAMADRLGYVETLPDRTVDPERGYPIMCSRTRWGRVSPTVPLNYHVQSTAMWCTMKAMIRCQDQLDEWNRVDPSLDARMAMQVHDEIVFDLPDRGAANLPMVRRLRLLMEQSGDDVGVPLKVSIGHHPSSWGESAPMPTANKKPRPKVAGGKKAVLV